MQIIPRAEKCDFLERRLLNPTVRRCAIFDMHAPDERQQRPRGSIQVADWLRLDMNRRFSYPAKMFGRITKGAGAVSLLVAATLGPAEEPPDAADAFERIVSEHTYTATLEDGLLKGPGADWLVAQGQRVDHFLMSERHGTAQIPAVAATLYQRLAEHGYGPVALEIGPFAARAVNGALAQGGYEALEALMTRYQGPPVAFLNWREEARMAARMVEAGAELWGLDQEFVFSLPMHLDALEARAETEREKTSVGQLRARLREELGGESGKALGAAEPSTLHQLRTAFEPRGDPAALARIDALIESNAIYAPYVRETGSWVDSQTRREGYMKGLLIDYMRDWERRNGEAPDVFYKHAHVGKRRQGADIFLTLGAFVAEWSRVRDEAAFHVLADCHGGKIPTSGQGEAGECVAWLGASDSPFAGHLREDAITVIDLRPLRSRYSDWDFLSRDLRTAIFAFDTYVAIPDVHPSKPLNEIPAASRE